MSHPTSLQIYWAYVELLKNPKQIIFERIISYSDPHSYHYAKDVLKGRFILGEGAISQYKSYAEDYGKYCFCKDDLNAK